MMLSFCVQGGGTFDVEKYWHGLGMSFLWEKKNPWLPQPFFHKFDMMGKGKYQLGKNSFRKEVRT